MHSLANAPTMWSCNCAPSRAVTAGFAPAPKCTLTRRAAPCACPAPPRTFTTTSSRSLHSRKARPFWSAWAGGRRWRLELRPQDPASALVPPDAAHLTMLTICTNPHWRVQPSSHAPEGRAISRPPCTTPSSTEKAGTWNLPFVTATGRSIWMRTVGTVEMSSAQPVMLSGAVQDVTERRQRDESCTCWSCASAASKNSILITDASDVHASGPHIVFANQAFEALTGYSQAEILGQTPRLLQGPIRTRQRWPHPPGGGPGESINEELLNYGKDGTPYWIEISLSPVRSNMGGDALCSRRARRDGPSPFRRRTARCAGTCQASQRLQSQFWPT